MHKWILILFTYLAELVCGNENGRCEDMCNNVDGIISCTCTNINETLAPPDDRICLCKLTILILVLPTSILFAIHTMFCIDYSTSHCMMKCMKMIVPLYIILYTMLMSFNWAVTVKLFLIALEGGFSQQMIIV